MIKHSLMVGMLVLSGSIVASELTSELKQALNTKPDKTKKCDVVRVDDISYCLTLKAGVVENGSEYFLLSGVPFDATSPKREDMDSHVSAGLIGATVKKEGKFTKIMYQSMGSWGKAPENWKSLHLKNKLVWVAEDAYGNGGVSETYLKMIDEHGKNLVENVQIGFNDSGRCADTKCEKKATMITGAVAIENDQLLVKFTGKKEGKKINKTQELKWNEKSQQYIIPKDYLL